MIHPDRVLTTWLFVTSIDPVQIKAAADAKPDCVIVDMEDFTPPHLREQGRQTLGETLSLIKKAGAVPCVRINPTGTPDHADDLAAALGAGAEIISLPKTASATELYDLIGAIGRQGGAGDSPPLVLPCIETAEGLVNTYAILKDMSHLIGCLVASEDMTTSLGAPRDPAGTAIRYARERFLLECRAAGIEPVDCPYTWADREGLVAETAYARALGYHAKSAARADQIAVIRDILEPDAAEVDHAERVVAAFEAAERDGIDRVEVDGQLVERPSYLNAKALLARSDQG
ncbi:MAG: CoA ester lyase [Rhodospirillales bacterium]|nr:CoA ester lyase [Rhodospirillales bacterium]MBO6785655.1 CoA ester lyase [Rhodospirillales bacterium]